MPILQINTPNLITDLAQIDSYVSDVEANKDDVFEDFINSCFVLKPTQDCDTLKLIDSTDYQELVPIDIDYVSISYSLEFENKVWSDTIACSSSIPTNESLTFDNLNKDGLYCAKIDITYIDQPDTLNEVTYTKTVYAAYQKDCCTELFDDLASAMKSKMASIGCTIVKYSKIGRNVSKLKDSYLKISNLKWVYDNSFDSCYEREKVFCIYNKIK